MSTSEPESEPDPESGNESGDGDNDVPGESDHLLSKSRSSQTLSEKATLHLPDYEDPVAPRCRGPLATGRYYPKDPDEFPFEYRICDRCLRKGEITHEDFSRGGTLGYYSIHQNGSQMRASVGSRVIEFLDGEPGDKLAVRVEDGRAVLGIAHTEDDE